MTLRRVMRRLFLALFSTAILTVGAGSATASSPHAAGGFSPAQTTVNEQQCTPLGGGARLCLALASSTFIGQATVYDPPFNCAGYRASLYDWHTNEPVSSTSLRPCGESPSKQATADVSRFTNLTAYAVFRMYNQFGTEIVYANTVPITYP